MRKDAIAIARAPIVLGKARADFRDRLAHRFLIGCETEVDGMLLFPNPSPEGEGWTREARGRVWGFLLEYRANETTPPGSLRSPPSPLRGEGLTHIGLNARSSVTSMSAGPPSESA